MSRPEVNRRRAALVGIVLSGAITFNSGGLVLAGTLDVVVDSTDLTVKDGKDGAHVAEVTLANVSDKLVTLEAEIAGDPGCSVVPKPPSIQPGRRVKIELEMASGCDADHGTDVTLLLGGGATPPTLTLTTKAVEDDKPEWGILWLAGPLAALGALVVQGYVIVRIQKLNTAAEQPDAAAARLRERRRIFFRRQDAREARGLSLTSLGDEPTADDDEVPRIGWSTPLGGLGTSWSFKDAWVANVTVGSTALVAILATADVLEAAIGDKPEAALSLILVTGALATALVGLAPLLLKAIGKEEGTATVGGTMVASFVVLFGSLLQVSAVTLQASRLVSNEVQRVMFWIIGLAVAVAILEYSAKAITGFVDKGSRPPAEPAPPEIRAAWIVAKAIRPNLVSAPLNPLEIEEILLTDPGMQAAELAEMGLVIPEEIYVEPRRSAML